MKLKDENRQNNINRALRAFDKLRKFLTSLESLSTTIDLSKLDILALGYISQKDQLIMSELAKGLNVGVSTSTGIIDRLIKKGLVFRERNHGDRRIVRVKLTTKGKETALVYQKQMREIFGKMMNRLTGNEQRRLISIMEKIATTENRAI